MSTNTTKLQLKKPLVTDEIETTIEELAKNFQILDNISDDYVESLPLSGFFPIAKRFYNSAPKYGAYIGWVNTRAGDSAPVWDKVKSYKVGDHIVPTTDNGHYYECIQTGYSGLLEPIFPVSIGAEFTDTRRVNTWQPTTQYKIDDMVFPIVDNGRFYVCIQSGESGNTQPIWQVVDGATTYDKNAVWKSYRIAKWKERGIASFFRPYGKIE